MASSIGLVFFGWVFCDFTWTRLSNSTFDVSLSRGTVDSFDLAMTGSSNRRFSQQAKVLFLCWRPSEASREPIRKSDCLKYINIVTLCSGSGFQRAMGNLGLISPIELSKVNRLWADLKRNALFMVQSGMHFRAMGHYER